VPTSRVGFLDRRQRAMVAAELNERPAEMDISGKTAIVTGAASGIGLGIATALAEAGANVVMADIQKEAVEQAAHALSGTNKQVMPVRIDVTQEQSVLDALHDAEQHFGKLHIACNNAGVPMHGTKLVDVPVGDWAFVIGVNIWGIIHGIRHFVPAILKHGEAGHIVNTASVAGFQNRRGTNQGPYSMSKYAALSLSEALEHELEGTNVGVSVLCPGPINTNIARGARNRPDHMGGPQVRTNDEAMLAERLATTGLDPKTVGERVVDAIRTKTFYAFVSAVPANLIKARHRRIEDALNSPWVTHY
jgi:NAD(P)-dependent dehydrogenase (short-subunit alcohol dehydrogenase family)